MKKKNFYIDIVLVGFRSELFLPRLHKDLDKMSAFENVVHYSDNTGNPKTLSACWNDLAKIGRAPYIAIMNPDISLSPDWDRRLVKAIELGAPHLGIATPDPLDSSPTAAPQPSSETMKELASERRADRRVTTESVQFYLAVIRRSIWERLKGVDERMRFYVQDSDFIRRAQTRLGLTAGRVHSCPVWHRGSASTGEAIRRGEIDQSLEHRTSITVCEEITAGRLKDWDLLTDAERVAVRSHPVYSRMGAQ